VKKNNREYTSAIVGIELKFSKDLDHLITKMKENGFFGEYLNDKPETLRFLI
jgi:threonine dehydratase